MTVLEELEKLEKLNSELEDLGKRQWDLHLQRSALRDKCPHPPEKLSSRQAGMGGDWGYWTEHTCKLCGYQWNSDQWG